MKGMQRKKLNIKLKVMVIMAMIMTTITSSIAFAGGSGTSTNLEPVKDALTSAFTVGEIASVIGIVIGTGVSFVLVWWGSRKLVNAIISAFKSGKLKF